MFANLFKTTTHKAYTSSLIFSLLVVLFVQYCKNFGTITLEMIPRALLFWGIFVLVILMVSFLETRYTYNNYGAIHLLSFPMVFLFFPHGPGLVVSKIFLGMLLIYSKYVYSKVFFSENSSKNLFDLSLILSLLVLYSKVYLVFYFLPISILIRQKFRDRKHLVSILLPAIIVPPIFIGIFRVVPEGMFESFYSVLTINIWDFESQSKSELLWLIALFGSFFVTVFYYPRGYEKISSPERFSGFSYMSFWFYVSVFVGFLGLHTGQGRWFLSFIPAAYFVGIFLEKIKSSFFKNILISISLISAIVFKLIDFEIVSL